MKKISKILDVFVFIATTLAIAGVFYEGMELQWFSVVGIFIICMDYSFIPATIIHLIIDRKNKCFIFHIVSIVAIIVAIIMKVVKIEYPTITLVIWYFYIWFLYGGLNVKNWSLFKN